MNGLLRLIIIFISLCFFSREMYAATYTPSTTLFLHGMNADVNFTVAPFFLADPGATAGVPVFSTVLWKFTGAFYAKSFWWVQFQTGSYSVGLSCSEDIKNLTLPCILTGTWYNENYWEIWFQWIQYDPKTGRLSGKAHSFFRDISLDGIYLPLRSAKILWIDGEIISNNSFPANIADAQSYGNSGWSLQICPPSDPWCGVSPNLFDAVGSWMLDLSEEWIYSLRITDPNGSKTEDTFTVKSWKIDQNKTLYWGNLAKPWAISSRRADGKEEFTIDIDFRDKLWNPADTTGMRFFIEVAGENPNVAIATNQLIGNDIPDVTNPYYYNEIIPDTALHVTSSIPLLKSSLISLPSLGGYDIGQTSHVSIRIASIAPSSKFILKKLSYTIDWVDTNLLTSRYNNNLLIFEPLVDIVTPVPKPLTIGERLSIVSSMINALDPSSITDLKVIHGFSLGSANTPRHFEKYIWSTPLCSEELATSGKNTNPECNFSSLGDIPNPSIVAFSDTVPSQNISWSGTTSAEVTYTPVITYTLSGERIVYYGNGWKATPTPPPAPKNDPVKVIGWWAVGWDGVSLNSLFQDIRKNIAELTRNGVPVDANYSLFTTPKTISQSDFDTKRSIFIIGSDATISEDILNSTDTPFAIVALKDTTWKWGQIFIDTNVTDIHATLVAEKAILANSPSAKQLFINGSLYTFNTTSGSVMNPPICPYFIAQWDCSPSTAKQYDLVKFREFVPFPPMSDLSKTSTLANSVYSGSAFVIQYDERVVQDPPPGFTSTRIREMYQY